MAFLTLEDLRGRVEVVVRAKAFAAAEAILKSGEAVVVSGAVQLGAFGAANADRDDDPGEPKIVLEDAVLLADHVRSRTQRVQIRIRAETVGRDRLLGLRELLGRFRGRCAVSVHLVLPSRDEVVVSLPDELRVDPTEEMLTALDRLFGERVAECH